MQEQTKDKIIFFLLGIFAGMVITVFGGICVYKIIKGADLGFNLTLFQPKPAVTGETSSAPAAPIKDFFFSFENDSDLKVFQVEGASAEVSNEHATDGSKSLMLKIQPGGDFPGLAWEVYGRTVQNWKSAKEFQVDIYNNTDENIDVEIKFKSGRDYPKKSYSYRVILDAMAMNNVRIPMSTIGNMCDLGNMSYLKIFPTSVSKPIVLYLDSMGIKK